MGGWERNGDDKGVAVITAAGLSYYADELASTFCVQPYAVPLNQVLREKT